MLNSSKKTAEFFRDEDGASVVEYAVLIALIATVLILITSVIGKRVSNAYDSVNSKIP